MTATNKPMTGAQLDELMAVAMRMQSDSEKMGERPVSIFAYAVQIAVLEIREVRRKYEELQSQNADLAVQLANAESKCRELAAENVGLRKALTTIANSEEFHGDTVVCDFDTLVTAAWSALSENPATDAFLAEVRAQGVEMYADNIDAGADDAECSGFDDAVKFLRSEALAVREFAAQLRKGAAS